MRVQRYRCLLCRGRWKSGGRAAWEEHYRVMHYQTVRRAVEPSTGGGGGITPGNFRSAPQGPSSAFLGGSR